VARGQEGITPAGINQKARSDCPIVGGQLRRNTLRVKVDTLYGGGLKKPYPGLTGRMVEQDPIELGTWNFKAVVGPRLVFAE